MIFALALLRPVQGAEPLFITEFMAQNDNGLRDNYGQLSDWIEIHNAGTNPIDLGGYYLTDVATNLTKWAFPAKPLPPKSHLLVFASGLDERDAGRPFHTNFRLAASGEFLALVAPDGTTIVHGFSPEFPPQQPDVSFGLTTEDLRTEAFIPAGADARVIVPSTNMGLGWTQVEMDDSQWLLGPTAIKFDRATVGFDTVPGTDIEEMMFGKNPGAYIRLPFVVPPSGDLDDFHLLMRYDDGYVAYLNGREIARRLAPAALAWNSSATGQRSNTVALKREWVGLADKLGWLKAGTNLLAVHGLNRSLSDTDFLILPELIARQTKIDPSVPRYFELATPGAANFGGLPGSSGPVRFSRETETFVTPFELVLEPEETIPGALVRYTMDRSLPNETSPVYSKPMSITNTVQVRARVFAPGRIPGPVRTETFIALSSGVVNFTSDLPIIIIHTLGGGTIGAGTQLPAFVTIHEPIIGRSALTNRPNVKTRGGFKRRGSSTEGQTKPNYAVEFWDELNSARNIELLGMPADSDWVFHAPYNFDPALIRNPLAFEMSHQLGRYSPRYRFAEVYMNSSGGVLTPANYAGVYNILEKIKVGKNRVNIDPLLPSDTQAPEVTGGYLMKIDRFDPGDSGFRGGGQQVAYVEPKESEMESPERDPQEKYIAGYLNAFATALNGTSFADPVRGYAPFVNAGSWIDHQIVDTLTFNVDALRLSSYFHKARNGPLIYGPVWDYDRSLGSTDGRDVNPRIWGDSFWNFTWWTRMFRDPNFLQLWIDRWQNIREAQFSDSNLVAMIDSLGAQVAEAAPRDFAKWRQSKRGGSQQGELNHLKDWLLRRADFMDTNWVRKPILSRASGQLPFGQSISVAFQGVPSLYYTLDGTDPRLPGGQLNPAALLYDGPIRVNGETTLKVRARNLNHRYPTGGNNPPIISPWSGLAEARYSTWPAAAYGQLAVTEIYHHPLPPTAGERAVNPSFERDDFQFLELKNVSGAPIDLGGAKFTRGIDFNFTGTRFETLGAGQTVLIVKRLDAFVARFGQRTNVAGQFEGTLAADGERLELVNARGDVIFDFEYRRDWRLITSGLGYSLVLKSDAIPAVDWEKASSWRPSAIIGGSPGIDDGIPGILPQVLVNEALPWSSRKDAIELFNPETANANIGGWFLTDDYTNPRKYRIPTGLTIPAGGYLVLDEDDFDAPTGGQPGFSLNRAGEGVYLFSADPNGSLLWYMHGFEYSPAERDVSFGRHVTRPGKEHFVAQLTPTLGFANSGPRVGPLVISEIMHHPPDFMVNGVAYDNDQDEFIELHNVTDQPVPLFDPEHATNTWSISSAVEFSFPTNVTVAPRGFLLLVNFDPSTDAAKLTAFKSLHDYPAGTPLFGPFRGRLNNRSETILLEKPAPPDADSDTIKVHRIVVDKVNYEDDRLWPTSADGLGHSLQRRQPLDYGNDAAHWLGARPTPGTGNRIPTALTLTLQPASQDVVSGAQVQFKALASGEGVVRYQWRFGGENILGATNQILNLPNVQMHNAGRYGVVAFTDGAAVSSEPATLTVRQSPTILVQPQGRNVAPGTNIVLGVTVRATGALSYQWSLNGNAIAGATEAILSLSNIQLNQSGAYQVTIRDAIGSVTSNPATVNVLLAPKILEQPSSQYAFVGDTVKFQASVIGSLPLSSRWRKNSIAIASGTNLTLVLPNVQLSDAAVYSLQITNIASSRAGVFSDNAELIVFEDLDNDRMADAWETANGLASNSAADSLLDIDGDGLTNAQEFAADTNPRDPASVLKLGQLPPTPSGSSLQFEARAYRRYVIEYRDSLAAGNWITLTNFPGGITNRVLTISEPRLEQPRFYRLVIPAR